MGNCLSEGFVSEEEHNRVRTFWISHNQDFCEILLQGIEPLTKSDFDQKRALNRLETIQKLLQDEIAFCKQMEHKHKKS